MLSMSTANEFAAALNESERDIRREAHRDGQEALILVDQTIRHCERRALATADSAPMEATWWDALGEAMAGANLTRRREFAVLLAVLVQVETAGLSRELAGFLEQFGHTHEAALRRAGAEIAGTE
jgi:hypothetical protein